MKIYIAGKKDSLRIISAKYCIELKELILLNPRISDIDMNIAGWQVRLPSEGNYGSYSVPTCPPPKTTGQLMNQFIPLASLEQMAQTDYDVLIIGSGAGGSASAWRLCQQWRDKGKTIGVIERGPILLQTHSGNLPTLDGRFWDYFLNPRVSIPIGKRLPDLPGARIVFALGGRTLFWGLNSPRAPSSELLNYPVPLQEMEFYYKIAEQMMNVNQYLIPVAQSFLYKLWANGFPEAEMMPRAVNLSPEIFGNTVNFSSISFLAAAFKQRSYDLAIHSTAVRILTQHGAVSGVQVIGPDRKSYVLNAKTVIVSANTFETPRLLLNSQIKGNAIGHYLTNHSFLRFGFEMGLNLEDIRGPANSFFIILIPSTDVHPYQFQIETSGKYSTAGQISKFKVDGYALGKVESRYENKVFLDPQSYDEFGMPNLQVQFSYSEQDLKVIDQMMDRIKKISKVLGISPNIAPSICLEPPGSDYHEMGTCRMGVDPAVSATNPYGQIHDVPGLYVADNSILRGTVGANPTLTTVALAIRTADYIAGTNL